MSSLAQFIKFAQILGLKKHSKISDLAQTGAAVAQVPTWSGTAWGAQATLEDMSVVRSGKDANGIYTTVQHKRSDGTLYRQSVLSGGASPNYTTRTVTFYAADGVTVIATAARALVYSGSDVISETLQ